MSPEEFSIPVGVEKICGHAHFCRQPYSACHSRRGGPVLGAERMLLHT
jgi:hypothetical protein